MITSMMRRALFSGDGSTLTLDFTTGVLDPRLTFTRGSGTNISGTGPSFIGSNGYVQYAGTNVPRFDYDPSTLAARGLLMESQATNLLTNSNDLTTGWTWTHISDLTLFTSPDNSNNATFWEATSGNATIIRTAAVGTSAQRTFSFWAKRDTGSGDFQYTLDNGGTWTTLAVTSSWVRYVIAATTANHQVGFRIQTNGNIFGIWGCQLEEGSGATSYIPTSANTATRVEDLAVMTNITALNYSTTNGTLFYSGRFTQINALSYPTRAGFQQAGGANPSFEYFTNGTLMFTAARGASGNPEVSTSATLNADFRWAASFDASLSTQEVKVSLNGGAILNSSATGLTATHTPTQFALSRAGFGLYFPSGTVRQVKYWPTTLSNARLQSLTT